MTSAKTALASELLHGSAEINSSIEQIASQLRTVQETLTGVRPPANDRTDDYEAALKRYGELRGRATIYPYLGSGIGNGALVELADGSVKWDMITGIGVQAFGHGDPELVETAIRAAMSDMVMQGNLQCNEDALAFADVLVREAGRGSDLKHAFLINSGALANETALKICMQRTGGAPRVLAFEHCFMGRTTTMCQLGDSAAGRQGIPLSTQVDYLPFHDAADDAASTQRTLDRLTQYLDRYPGQHACCVMELIQGEGGFKVAPASFFKPLMELCRERGVPIWVDEVQTFGRTTDFMRFQGLGLGEFVDVATVGKLSQTCACIYTEAMNPRPGLLSATFIGSTVALRVGRRVLERLIDGGYYGENGRIAALYDAFHSRATALVDAHPAWFPPIAGGAVEPVGGLGGMMRFTPFGGDKTAIWSALRAMYDDGVVAFYCGHGPFHVRFLPPVGVLEPKQFDDVFAIVERSLERAASAD